MHLKHLRIENLRLIERLALDLSPGWNFFVGGNGAGKTTLLEAAFLLSHGRSFRTGVRDVLPRHGGQGYSVYAELIGGDEKPLRVGIARAGQRLEARISGETVPAADLMRHVAVLCFEPGSHELISAGSEERRRFLDWGVFHVEHDFLRDWRRYQRALKQRNALLRRNGTGAELDTWDHELAVAALPITTMRQRYFDRLRPIMVELLAHLLGELGLPRLSFHPGFDVEQPLEDTLLAQREKDLIRGHTGTGPHRAGWSLVFEGATRREYLSRGQEKLCAFAATLAQARLHAEHIGDWPVVCVDDLASEVDRAHQRKLIELLAPTPAQLLVTGTEPLEGLANLVGPIAMFHVEHGDVTPLL